MLKFILNFLFPQSCLGCNAEGTICCLNCQKNMPLIHQKTIIQNCPHLNNIFIASCYSQNPIIKKLIHFLKYKGDKNSAPEILGKILMATLNHHGYTESLKLIPVPLHPKRQRSRGFNQAELLAQEVYRQIQNSQLETSLIQRIRNTKSQVQIKSREARLQNLKDAFQITKSVKNENYLLIDDVCTTGSTLEECAKTLKKAGAKHVNALVLARNI